MDTCSLTLISCVVIIIILILILIYQKFEKDLEKKK